jgi:hypothetical protein
LDFETDPDDPTPLMARLVSSYADQRRSDDAWDLAAVGSLLGTAGALMTAGSVVDCTTAPQGSSDLAADFGRHLEVALDMLGNGALHMHLAVVLYMYAAAAHNIGHDAVLVDLPLAFPGTHHGVVPDMSRGLYHGEARETAPVEVSELSVDMSPVQGVLHRKDTVPCLAAVALAAAHMSDRRGFETKAGAVAAGMALGT